MPTCKRCRVLALKHLNPMKAFHGLSLHREFCDFIAIVLVAALSLLSLESGNATLSNEWFVSAAWAQPSTGCVLPQSAGSAGFLHWLDFGGPGRADLPGGSLDALGRSSRDLLEKVVPLCAGTSAIASEWSRVSGKDDAELIMASPALLDLMGKLDDLNSAAMKAAVANKIQVAEALALVDRRIGEDQHRQKTLADQVTQSQQKLTSARSDLENADNQLKGDKGFLNGFLTGLTFGIYNPLQENVDKANRAVADVNQQLQSIQNQKQQLLAAQNELENKRRLLDVISRMDSTMTDFQNSVNAAQDPLSRARENFEKSSEGRMPALAKMYLQRARTAMTELSSWVPAFNSVVERLALKDHLSSKRWAMKVTIFTYA